MVVVQAAKRPSLQMLDSSRSGPVMGAHNLMNAAVTEQDSLYYVALNIKKRLEVLPQIQPYLNLAYTSSELLSERQSLLLSQKQQQQLLEQAQNGGSANGNNNKSHNHRSISSTSSNDGFMLANGNSSASTMRASSISNISFKDEYTLDGITYNSSNGHNSVSMDDTQLTYSMGILPISMDCDPVTQMAQLFQQGSPLCILFNTVKPQYKLPVVSSDDLKICKKSIYDFILGCKKHFAFTDEELFTISDVFANSTNQLVKVFEVVTTLMNAAPDIFPSTDKAQQIIDAEIAQSRKSSHRKSKSQDEYEKVIREFIATERKYVHDLEILNVFKQQLLDNDLITSEELYMLFPNLTEVIDFQRRFLISLEINALVDPQKQRIGALFMHSKFFFKLYEPWSIGQNAAIDFLSNTMDKVHNPDLVIKNKLEVQSFLYKPVQRLCRYPLLLKELISCIAHDESSASDHISKELEIALDISKIIAMSINENQRRTENHEVVKKLYGRVSNWKGYRIAKFGELLYYDKVFISTNNSSEPEREFEVYLFEKIIVLFSEIQPKKTSLILKKKSSSSGSTLALNLTSSNHHNSLSGSSSGHSSGNSSGIFGSSSSNSSEPKLDLRGRIMIMNLNQVNPMNSRSLNITWESIKEQGNFLLKFKNEETRDNWSSCLQSLVRSAKSESFKSTVSENSFVSTPTSSTGNMYSERRHDSTTSNSSLSLKRLSDALPKPRRRASNFDNGGNIPEHSLIVKITYNSDSITVPMELTASFPVVMAAIEKNIGHKVSKVKYQDEDGDYIVLASDDDWTVARDMLKENNERLLNVWAYN
ncbi:Rho family guanine nucleotide exchange factor [Maudiozyma humilis]|uniref:Rho family guanine nucleotide exchange factor n=1 Tax=Maudiozyma humilis TaxID=51915 RepID=A0AAV5RWW6_MAUHU|nr:Rho family guanine nucleotide exchange factor [Kazachstania humilis]